MPARKRPTPAPVAANPDQLARKIVRASGLTISAPALDSYLSGYAKTPSQRAGLPQFRAKVRAALREQGAKIVTGKRSVAPKPNTAPVRTKVAAHRRSLALRSGNTGRTPVSVVAARLGSKSLRVPGGKARKEKARQAASAEMRARRASLNAAERSALASLRERDPQGWKPALSRAGRAGELTGELATAFAKLGPGGVFTYPASESAGRATPRKANHAQRWVVKVQGKSGPRERWLTSAGHTSPQRHEAHPFADASKAQRSANQIIAQGFVATVEPVPSVIVDDDETPVKRNSGGGPVVKILSRKSIRRTTRGVGFNSAQYVVQIGRDTVTLEGDAQGNVDLPASISDGATRAAIISAARNYRR